MKKMSIVSILLLMFLIAVGCNGATGTEETDDTTDTPGDTQRIVIMTGAPHEIDPFHESYSGLYQMQKQDLQTAVEETYNVEIVYQMYPAHAPWGPDRVNAIIQSSVSGSHLADLYIINTDWIQQLAVGDAIAPINPYLHTHGANIHQGYIDVTTYKEQVYGFSTGMPTADRGLFYNADLVASLGVPNPTQMFLDGEWNWSNFEAWADTVKLALSAEGEDYFALGGQPVIYAESLVPLNGGRMINALAGRVNFHQTEALDTYSFIQDLWDQGLFEPTPDYDSGSSLWQTGRVAMHPGNLWFLTADNRWGNVEFEIGFVPYPVADDFDGDYITPISGVTHYALASGMTPEREELVFEVWNALQVWRDEAELRDEFELTLLGRFDEEIYVEAYMEIFDSVYFELLHALGINRYQPPNGFYVTLNPALKGDLLGEDDQPLDPRSAMDAIRPIYQAALDDYLDD